MVLYVLDVMEKCDQWTTQSSGAVVRTGPDECADLFQRWREEISNVSQVEEGLEQVQKCNA